MATDISNINIYGSLSGMCPFTQHESTVSISQHIRIYLLTVFLVLDFERFKVLAALGSTRYAIHVSWTLCHSDLWVQSQER